MSALASSFRAIAALLAILAPAGLAAQRAAPATVGADEYKALHWRNIGPEGNRFSAATGVAGDPYTYYVGAASGGIWKTSDGGVHWVPIFDAQPVQSIGSLAVAPSDPNLVWAGTGEAHIRSHISIGQGIYRSTDAGKTWTLMGLEKTGRIARIAIHPTDPNTVLACALGTAYGPQPDRGVFRTTDGGATWTKVLFVDENTGCSDLAMDPTNPRILFAGLWTIEIKTWGRFSGGPGGGLFQSKDGGTTWTRLKGAGLPTKQVGKVALAIARSNPQRVYAMIETGDGVPWNGQETESGQLWRTDDGGATWTLVSRDRNAMGRAHYYSRVAVSPASEDELYFLTASYAKSIDGGRTIIVQQGQEAAGGDHHDIWIDPSNANRMIVAHDQGLSITINRGKTWMRQRLKNAQIYHVTVDNNIPYNVLGNKQDEPTYRGPSNSRVFGFGRSNGISRGMWHSVGGGESGWATPDPVDPNLIWSTASGSGMVGGIIVRFDESRRQFRNVEVWPHQSNGPASGVKYRFVWDAPFLISPHDHNTLYTGSQHVHRSQDGGQSWQVISPDLTLNDRSKMGPSGGLTGDNIGVEYAGVVYGIAESPRERGVIWAGTNDGQVQLTRDNGASWTNLTKNLPGIPSWGSVRSIAPSKWDAATAYLTVDAHQENIRDPFVYRTADYGRTWKLITAGIPKSNVSYAKVIIEDPVRRGMLYLGTENAIYFSYDAGDSWLPLQNDLPQAPVSGIAVQEHFNDLVISTYGRGFWILDDLAPLQQLTPEIAASAAHLFPPRPAYRFRPITAPSTQYDDPTTGEDPEYGAAITYHLKAPAGTKPKITILDAQGQLVRTLDSISNKAGFNRVSWDLRDTPSSELRLLTSPMFAPHIVAGASGRVAPGAAQVAILMPPGTYTVKLTVDGKDYTQPLIVRKDPNSAGTEAEIVEQVRTIAAIRRDIEEANSGVRRAESVRAQLEALIRVAGETEVTTAAKALDAKIVEVEQTLVDLRQTGNGQDGVRFGSMLLAKLGYLANGVSVGDFRPTNQHAEVQQLLNVEVATQLRVLDQLLSRELESLNGQLKAKALPTILDRARPARVQP